jgi:hypothetical protein
VDETASDCQGSVYCPVCSLSLAMVEETGAKNFTFYENAHKWGLSLTSFDRKQALSYTLSIRHATFASSS